VTVLGTHPPKGLNLSFRRESPEGMGTVQRHRVPLREFGAKFFDFDGRLVLALLPKQGYHFAKSNDGFASPDAGCPGTSNLRFDHIKKQFPVWPAFDQELAQRFLGIHLNVTISTGGEVDIHSAGAQTVCELLPMLSCCDDNAGGAGAQPRACEFVQMVEKGRFVFVEENGMGSEGLGHLVFPQWHRTILQD
jgi:hypothetical protein